MLGIHETTFPPLTNIWSIVMSIAGFLQRVARSLVVAAFLGSALAMAQSEPSLNEVYAAARGGNLDQAQTMVQQVLVTHPNSAKAHYVRSELFARQGDLRHAREELNIAQRLAPGLPFAKTESVQALQTQLGAAASRAGSGTSALRSAGGPPAPSPSNWGLPLLLTGAVVAGGYMLFRRRPPQGIAPQGPYAAGAGLAAPEAMGIGGGAGAMQPAYSQQGTPQPGYAPPGYAPPAASGLGGRIMGGVATGLAVGAGVVAAETIGRSLLSRNEPVAGGDNTFVDRPDPNRGSSNADMGGQDFGMRDASSWDDGNIPNIDSGDWDT
ncbi:MAG: hypothetical protein KIT63_05160 [Rhodoferax sp.]|nr:hypothetical protein [Rhodoferax sp.]